MTKKDQKLATAFRQCADARLPKDFADRLVRRIKATGGGKRIARIALLAASLAMLLGFVPVVLPDCAAKNDGAISCRDSLRPGGEQGHGSDTLSGWALLGFCHEALLRRMRTLRWRCRRREEE